MVFASITFLVFFLPLLLGCYYFVSPKLRNMTLLLFCVLFYVWGGGGRDLFILLMVATTDFFIARCVATSKHPHRWLVGAIVWNLSILCFFKYAAFFASGLKQLFPSLGLEVVYQWVTGITLPLGISFFIFETISYLVDVRRGVTPPAKRWTDYAMYLSFFPHLIAGPIYRYAEIVPDLDAEKRDYRLKQLMQGLFLFSFGLAKKCLVANPMAELADKVFGLSRPSLIDAWCGALAYTFQIYFDFSGYSTMAIGLGLLLGFHLPDNFNQPYTALSVTEFWHRWHMTLSRWFRDYLYIPLGGNRGGTLRTYRNLAIVFVLCGLWHGASMTFVLWGVYHGGLLIVERVATQAGFRISLPSFARRFVTFTLVLFGWVLFRADTLASTLGMWQSMLGLSHAPTSSALRVFLLEDRRLLATFAVASLSLYQFSRPARALMDRDAFSLAKVIVAPVLLAWCLLELAAGTFNPFIYYRF